jgi:hypothetical protein
MDIERLIHQPVIDLECHFCHKRCFVPLTAQAPPVIIFAFIDWGANMLATCAEGQAVDRTTAGYCYDDILAAVPDYDYQDIGRTVELCSKSSQSETKNGSGRSDSLPWQPGLGLIGRLVTCSPARWLTNFTIEFR